MMDIQGDLGLTAECGGTAAEALRHPPARFRHAFIVTYGRSGSTLLQGLLNAIPGYLILGENWDTMGHLAALYRRLPRSSVRRASEKDEPREPTRPTNPFYRFENFESATFREGIRLFMEHVLLRGEDPAAIRCLGFKEIRYTAEDVGKKVDFLRAIFPGCAIIYNIRNPADVVESEFQRDKESVQFEQFNALLEARSTADPRSFLVRYEDVVTGTGSLPALYDFLGERYDRAAVDAVLAVKHSYHRKEHGQIYSDVPRFVQVNRGLDGFSLLVVDRFDAGKRTTKLGGLMIPSPEAPPRYFHRVLDAAGQALKFQASVGLPSPRLAQKLGNPAAGSVRFIITFTRRDAGEHRVFLDDGTLMLTVRGGIAPAPDAAAPRAAAGQPAAATAGP